MKPTTERRCPATVRVSHTALVDICTQTGSASPFQGESSNISGRGMHVRTSFLPEIGEELVCRFNHDDEEILVEGLVAWRAEGQDSGEFGIQFTALDADSAEVLQSLGEAPGQAASAPRPTLELGEQLEEEEEFFEVGSRVRLHIDGLGAPMKACVHEGSTRKLRVGSSLEFLKVGRALELEDVQQGQRRGAQVDSVNVVMNPSTSVPELVVQLRYEGVTPTPAPARTSKTTADFDDDAFGPAETEPRDLRAAEQEHEDQEEEESWEPAAEAIRARLSDAAANAGQVARKASSVLATLAKKTSSSVGQATSNRNAKVRKQTPGKQSSFSRPAPRAERRVQSAQRRARPAPSHLRSGIHELNMTGGSKEKSRRKVGSARAAEAEAPLKKRRSPAAAVFGIAFLVLGGSAYALRTFGGASDEVQEAQASPETSAQEAQVVAKVEPQTKKKSTPEPEDEGVLAEVPLFGPQAMAVKKAEPQPSAESVAEAERRAAAASVEDQSWDEPEPSSEASGADSWGKGRLYLPTIHRIRLDSAGASVAGAVNSDGFTVVIPGRKAMESGKAIEKRDKRIVAVKTNNNARGASVKFEFRGPVPPYKVRLRQDFVEFLISAPEASVGRL